jgi:hypothetical protein
MTATPQIDCRDVRLNCRIFDDGIIGGLPASRYTLAAVNSSVNVAYITKNCLAGRVELQDKEERET